MKPILSILSVLLFYGASAQPSISQKEFSNLQWLVGSWKGMAGTAPFYEAWRLANDSTLVNLSIEVKGGDTLVREAGALLLRGGAITLGQKPVWKASRLVSNELVLKNDSLPYSNTIIWLHTKDDHWFTILEHPKSTVYYDMLRDAALDRKVSAWIGSNRRN